MMRKECVAMLLAGGQGSRLGALTKKIAKPAVAFGGKYRIIDFSLSNCTNSGIDTVGVLTQYKHLLLNSYIGTGSAWDLNSIGGGVHILPPYATEDGGTWYKGTADAIHQNLDFISNYNPEYVLIISGDHLYKMDYSKMIDDHKKNNADLTISVIEVPWDEASRFGILTCDDDLKIKKFSEKPKNPYSNLASMGIYIFSWDVLRKALIEDAKDETSENDFGKNIIPNLLAKNKRLFAYNFEGYWKDVGTIDSYYEANMELLEENPPCDIFSSDMPIFSNSNIYPPHYVGNTAKISNSLISNGAAIFGRVSHSILSSNVYVDEDAVVEDSILLPGAVVKSGATVVRSIVGENTVIENGAFLGDPSKDSNIALLGDNQHYKKVDTRGAVAHG